MKQDQINATAEDLLTGLNPEQASAVRHERGPLLILAGPGSGKTRVICHRIGWLIRRRIAEPSQILAVTFTNKAAGEMKDRIAKLLGSAPNRMRLSTYHALCARILRIDGEHIDVPKGFVIYDRNDQLRAARDTIKQLGSDSGIASARSLMSRISRWKQKFETPDELDVRATNHRDRVLADAYRRYERKLRAARALDFDDLLTHGVALMMGTEEVRRRWAGRFRYILIDEYQDTNDAQYQLSRMLALEHRNVCAVGDPDQSIYGWRGADAGNVDAFLADFPEATVVRLERNYRSSGEIVAGAGRLIAGNPKRTGKRLWTGRQGGWPIEVRENADDTTEAEQIAAVAGENANASRSLAVLYRMNSQSRAIEDALRRSGTRYRIVGNIRFYERREVKDILAYLKAIINPDDDISLQRIINVPPRQIGTRTMEAIAAGRETGRSDTPLLSGAGDTDATRPAATTLWEQMREAVDSHRLREQAGRRVRGFIELLNRLAAQAAGSGVAEAVRCVAEGSGYIAALRSEGTEDGNERIANVMELAPTPHAPTVPGETTAPAGA